MDKITGVLDALQGIFGKGFVLAGFLPVILLLSVSWILGCWLSASCREFSEYLLYAKLLQKFALGVIMLLLVSMVSFVFWQLNAWFRQCLEGRIWPLSVQNWLSVEYRNKCRVLDEQVQRFLNEGGEYRRAVALWPAQLIANSTGMGNAVQDPNLDRDYQKLKRRFGGSRPVPFEDVEAFYTRLCAELRLTSLTAAPVLEEMSNTLCDDFLPRGRDMAQRELYRVIPERQSFPASEMSIGPTRLINLQEAQRDFISRTYGIDATLFWADLLKVASDNQSFAATLENAKTRLDFSIALTAVATTFTLGWIIMCGIFGTSSLAYVVVVVFGALATIVARQLVLINSQTFAETVRTTVELFRFDLLKAMHLPMPENSDREREIWMGLAQRVAIGIQNTVTYQHEAPQGHA
jgi:hypothetical protein